MSPRRNSNNGFVAILGAFLLLVVIVVGMMLFSGGADPPPAAPVATPLPTREIRSLQDIEELDDLYGGWQADDGRQILLNQDSTFVTFIDGDNMSGQWYVTENELCLVFSLSEQCHPYNQYSNVLKFGEATYYRY